jgi:hypothetical protein
MRQSLLWCGIALALLASPHTRALEACFEPEPPASVPDGATADYATMKEAMMAYRAYGAAMETYLACLERRAESGVRAAHLAYTTAEERRSQADRIWSSYVSTHDALLARAREVVERFNVELREWKTLRPAKNPEALAANEAR